MEQLKQSFEANLKQKLQQKSNSQTSEEQVLLKAFKFFDTNNSGTLDCNEFAKAIEKIGIMIPTKNDLDALFGCYDADGSGDLTYREFCSNIFGYAVGGATPSAKGNSGEALCDKLKNKLKSRGARGIIGLAR